MKEISRIKFDYPKRALNNIISKIRNQRVNPSDVQALLRYNVKLDTTEIEKFSQDKNFVIRKAVYEVVFYMGDSKKIIEYLEYEIKNMHIGNATYIVFMMGNRLDNIAPHLDDLAKYPYTTNDCHKAIKFALIDLFFKAKRDDLLLGLCFDSDNSLSEYISRKISEKSNGN